MKISASSQPVFQTIKQEEQAFRVLVSKYEEATLGQRTEEVNALLASMVRDFGINLQEQTYRGRPLPLTGKKLKAAALIAFELYRADCGQTAKPGVSLPAMFFSGTLSLLKRHIEVLKGLSASEESSMQKPVIEKAKELLGTLSELFRQMVDKMEPEQAIAIQEALRPFHERMPLLESAVKEKAFQEAVQSLNRMEDDIHHLIKESSGPLRRLFIRKPLAEFKTSYQEDLIAAQADLTAAGHIFDHFEELPGLKAFKQQTTALKVDLAQLPKEGTTTMKLSLQALDLRIRAGQLFQALVQFVGQKSDNAIDGLRL